MFIMQPPALSYWAILSMEWAAEIEHDSSHTIAVEPCVESARLVMTEDFSTFRYGCRADASRRGVTASPGGPDEHPFVVQFDRDLQSRGQAR
jgi:hypothetical protein